MSCRRININKFAEELREGLDERIQDFVRHMRHKMYSDPENPGVKSTREWTIEYQKWAKTHNLEQMLKDYIGRH